jgi:Zn-dependent protease
VNRSRAVRPSPIFLGLIAVAVAGGLLCAFAQSSASLTMARAGVFILVLAGWAVSLCLHEFGHAYTAYRGGDFSVRGKGYLDLDPRRYTHPVLSLVVPLFILLIGGIPLPGGAVWINQGFLRSKQRQSMVSLAGPLTNLALAIVLTIVVHFAFVGGQLVFLAAGLSLLAWVQVFAFLLNLLPIPGLDGWGALEPWLSPQARATGNRFGIWGIVILFLLLFLVPQVRYWVFAAVQYIYGAVGGNATAFKVGFGLFFFWRGTF